ncbi:Heparan-alpha-glucosaminide N-acetyltransferase [Chionoecetes opilio]|uniref:Heparan-alpha-glucosaminide N-acetyltransferase n=1 Tax=Chionoecetes opilio TaxID=41210 RepID=A0A8J4YEN4_CHIOP|nr:Heparan-alpha-glucosaminide N-acetyltransferase [Chionoecetes opilio]
MSLFHSTTPTCPPAPPGHHMKLGQACLEVHNGDSSYAVQLWAQAKECYKCPPWLYLTLPPNATQTLMVNTTYPTDLLTTRTDGGDLFSMQYHFGEYGNYRLGLGARDWIGRSKIWVWDGSGDMEVTRQPERGAFPLVIAALFFVLLTFMWQCAKFLQRRMDSSTTSQTRTTTSTESERNPLISPHRDRLTTSPQPSTSISTSTLQDNLTTTSELTVQVGLGAGLPLPDPRVQSGRLLSLDAFRGLAIVLMIFVNYGGGQYFFFKHARWNGLTVADLVFPWFLWIMGVSLVFSIRSQLRRATKRFTIVLRILKRCAILFALGILVNSTNGHNHLFTFRLLGVLQRFSLCYFLTALIEVYTTNPQESPEYVWYWRFRDIVRSGPQWVYTLVLVTVQLALTFGMPVPGCPMGYLGPGGLHDGGMYKGCTGGAAGYIDRAMMGRAHVYAHPTCASVYDSTTPYDPEGLLGVLTSVLMVQLGASCGRIITTHHTHRGRTLRWLAWGVGTGLLAGLLCGWRKEAGLIPVNKNLWSLSYVLCTASFAFILFTIFYVFIDERKWWGGNPLRYAGMNSIALYVGHEICGGLVPFSWQPVGQHHANHLIMNLWATSLWVVIAYVLHRKKLYFSV